MWTAGALAPPAHPVEPVGHARREQFRRRAGTVVPILGATRLEHLENNLAGLQVRLTPEHLRTLDEVSAPTLNYPAPLHGALQAMLQFAGTTVDGTTSTVYPPLTQSDVRY